MSAAGEPADDSQPDIPEQSWENPFAPETFLNSIYGDAVREQRDIAIVIDDYHARRGTGKTVSSLKLADAMDQTGDGVGREKTAIQAEELRQAYTREPKRSALVLDEAEVAVGNKDHMTNVNKAMREIVSMGRVEQKYLIFNAPTKRFVDKDLLRLCDVWITMVRRGLGLVHHLRWEPYSESLLTPRKQWIEFDDIPTGTPLRETYNYLTREKKSAMDGDATNQFITKSEHQEKLERAKKEIKREKRDDMLRKLWEDPRVQTGQKPLAHAAGISQGQVSNIVNGE